MRWLKKECQMIFGWTTCQITERINTLLKAYLVDARRRAIGVSTDTEEALLRTSHLFQVSLSTLSPSPLIPTPSHTVHRAPYTVHHAPRTVHHAPRTVHHASCTVHHAPRTTHRALKGFL
jgi:hypothetical protein